MQTSTLDKHTNPADSSHRFPKCHRDSTTWATCRSLCLRQSQPAPNNHNGGNGEMPNQPWTFLPWQLGPARFVGNWQRGNSPPTKNARGLTGIAYDWRGFLEKSCDIWTISLVFQRNEPETKSTCAEILAGTWLKAASLGVSTLDGDKRYMVILPKEVLYASIIYLYLSRVTTKYYLSQSM